jgi:poly(3-hydroxyalkanoate) synthetase
LLINLKQKILFFYNRISDIFTNKKFLISFLELLKEIYDKFGVNLTEGNIENNNIVVNNNYLNDIEEIKESSENEIHQIPQINENLSKSSNSNSITTNPNNVHQNISNLNINLISEGVVSNENQNHIQTPKYNNINDKNEEEMIEYKLKQDKNNSYQKLMTLIKDSYKKKKYKSKFL